MVGVLPFRVAYRSAWSSSHSTLRCDCRWLSRNHWTRRVLSFIPKQFHVQVFLFCSCLSLTLMGYRYHPLALSMVGKCSNLSSGNSICMSKPVVMDSSPWHSSTTVLRWFRVRAQIRTELLKYCSASKMTCRKLPWTERVLTTLSTRVTTLARQLAGLDYRCSSMLEMPSASSTVSSLWGTTTTRW